MWLKFCFLYFIGWMKLTQELGFILKLNTNILNSFLEQKGVDL